MDFEPALIRPPRFSPSQIIEVAEKLWEAYFRQCELPPELLTISFDALYDQVIYPEYGIALEEHEDLGIDSAGKKVYGRFDVETNTAHIDVSLSRGDPRRAFTCYHEVVGHGILQGDWLRREMNRLKQDLRIITTENSLDSETSNVLERQANLCASHIAAPTKLLAFAIDDVFRPTRPIRYIGPRTYTLDIRGCIQRYDVGSFNELCRIIARHIRFRFGDLSLEALSYRVQQMPILRDLTSPRLHLHRLAPSAASYAMPALATGSY